MLENRIKYRHLQCFLEVNRQGSVGRAADSLSLTQPAVSKKLKELEEMLGARLLERNKKGVELTAFGEMFLKYAGASVSALNEGANSIMQAQLKGRNRITIGVLPTVATSVLPRAVQRFRENGLDITLKLVSGPNSLMLNRLRVGELDLVVGRLGDHEQMYGLSFQHLYSERITFVVRKHHPLLRKKTISLHDINDYTVLCPPEESNIYPAVSQFLLSQGFGTLKDCIETISDSFGKEYIRQTDAIWVLSRGVVAREIKDGELCELPLDTKETLGPVGLTIRADTIPSPSLQLFMNSIRDSADLAGEP